MKQQRIRRLSDLATLRDELIRAGEAERSALRQRAADEQRAQQAADEFARAVPGTIPLAPAGRHRPSAPTVPRAPRSTVLTPDGRAGSAQRPRPVADGGAQAGEPESYRRPGVGPDILRKLRRGHWPVEGQFDLHGLHLEAAYRATGEYLTSARAQGLRCVLLIHGKGLGSAQGTPVLKGRMRAWLAHQANVAAYCEAPPALGGAGALLLLLRQAPATRSA